MVKAISVFRTVPAQQLKQTFIKQTQSKLPVINKPLIQYMGVGYRNASITSKKNQEIENIKKKLKDGKINKEQAEKLEKQVEKDYEEIKKAPRNVDSTEADKIVKKNNKNKKNPAFGSTHEDTVNPETLNDETVIDGPNFTSQPIEDIDVSLPESLQEIVDSDASIELLDSNLEGMVDDLADSLSDGENVQEIFNKIIDAT